MNQENENIKEIHLQMKKETLNDPKIQRFLSSHTNLSEQEIDVNLNKLYEYKTQSIDCSHCSSLEGCKNVLKGYTPILYVENDKIHLAYEKCKKRLEYEQSQEKHRSEEHTSELQSRGHLVCRLLLEKKKKKKIR